jgi:hypothetical protein
MQTRNMRIEVKKVKLILGMRAIIALITPTEVLNAIAHIKMNRLVSTLLRLDNFKLPSPKEKSLVRTSDS